MSPSLPYEKLNGCKKERWINFGSITSLAPLILICSVCVTLFLTLFFLQSPNPFKITSKHDLYQNNLHLLKPQNDGNENNCSLIKGQWVPDLNGSLYTGSSCVTIPGWKNCLKNGRMDRGYVNWRWKPDECELARFDPKTFLKIVKGKKMAFIGDSVARNHADSLVCLLSTEEIPIDLYKDSEDGFQTWYFPNHDFTLMVLLSRFLVTANNRIVNGSKSEIYDLNLDKIDHKWTEKLPTLDYAIISDGHWFFRPIHLYQSGVKIGCTYCNDRNVTNRGTASTIRMTFRAALNYVNSCKECAGLMTFVRTFSPAHFENGTWNNGGSCNRVGPLRESEVHKLDQGELYMELRGIQLEEVERAKREQKEKKEKKRFEVLDVTRPMIMRADGHPGAHWGNKWMKGINDCLHWCLPGPIDVWSDFLLALLRK